MTLDSIRVEIERMRIQIRRQQKDIQSLQRSGISAAAGELLLVRMRATIDGLCDKRDNLRSKEAANQG